MKRFFKVKVSALLFTLLCLQTAAYAFELRTASEISPTSFLRWDPSQGPIRMTLNTRGCPDLPIDVVESAMQSAIADWQNIPGKSYTIAYGGRSSLAVPNPDDNVNSVVWMQNDWPYSPEVISVTSYSYYIQDPPRLVDADIMLNSKYHYSIVDSDHSVDLRKVLLHELGHVLGLAHTSVYHASLYPYFNLLDAPSLKPDDRAGVHFLYAPVTYELRPITPLHQSHYLVSTAANRLPLPVFRWGSAMGQTCWLEFSATADFQKKLRYNAGSSNYLAIKAPMEKALWNLSLDHKVFWRVATVSGHSASRLLYFRTSD